MMKKFVFMSLIISVMFSGCSSDDSNSPVEPAVNCDTATEAAATAMVNYENATNENYVSACTAYKNALVAQKQQCGDNDGSIQAEIDSLGDCQPSQGTISVTAGTLVQNFENVSVVKEGGIIKVTGVTSSWTQYSIYFEVPENEVGENAMQNFEISLTSQLYPYMDEFHSNVTTNENGVLSGTFYGYVVNDDNGMLSLTNGNFNVTY